MTTRRRAVVAAQVLVMLVVLFGFAAFTIDIGTLYRARAELQTAADSAALAAASAYTTDAMLRLRLHGDENAFNEVLDLVMTRGSHFSTLNDTLGAPTLVDTGDINTGWVDALSSSDPIDTGTPPSQRNAVRVVARRAEGGGEGSNGPVEFFFAPIFGRMTGEASASAVAAFDDRFAGYDSEGGGSDVMPFTIHEDVLAAELAGGGDQFGYDPVLETVTSGPDGVREIDIYPHASAPGNFGLLNIGVPNQGVPGLVDQIENGVAPEDIEVEIGTPVLAFYDEEGSPVTYDITGCPGLKVSLESAIESRIDDTVGFLVHDQVTGSGANATYRITRIRFARVMGVKLKGAASSRGFWLQPVSYAGAGVRLGANAGGSNGMVGRLILAR